MGVCGFVVLGPMSGGLGETGFLGLVLSNEDTRSVPRLRYQHFPHEKMGFHPLQLPDSISCWLCVSESGLHPTEWSTGSYFLGERPLST